MRKVQDRQVLQKNEDGDMSTESTVAANPGDAGRLVDSCRSIAGTL